MNLIDGKDDVDDDLKCYVSVSGGDHGGRGNKLFDTMKQGDIVKAKQFRCNNKSAFFGSKINQRDETRIIYGKQYPPPHTNIFYTVTPILTYTHTNFEK